MQGNSESWRRLDRMRTASVGRAGRGSTDDPATTAGDPGGSHPAVADPAPTLITGPDAAAPAIEPPGTASSRGRHARRATDEDSTTAGGETPPEPLPAAAWLPDDDVEGPVVGAALDRWVARQAAVRRSDDGAWSPVHEADQTMADGSPDRDRASDVDRAGADHAGDVPDGAADGWPDEGERGRRPVSRWRAWLRRSMGRRAQLWVPEPLRGARVDPGRRGAMALLLVAALAAAITAVGVWRDRPEARPVTTVSAGSVGLVSAGPPPSSAGPAVNGAVTAGAAGDATALPAPGSGTPEQIVVSVTGLVNAPGVVTLPGDARVADAIAAAGGLAAGADVTGLNLAAKLTDGASVVVGAAGTSAGVQGTTPAGGGAAASSGSGTGLVDLNTADADELDTLPGVGPVMAANIVSWREANGRFSSVDQLQEISGIGPARYAQLSALVTVS